MDTKIGHDYRRHEYQFLAMTTPCTLTLYGGPADLASQIEQETLRLQTKYNFHQADSWLNQTLNRRQQPWLQLDPETAAVLRRVRDLSQACQGAFDICVGTLAHAAVASQLGQAMGLAAWQLEDERLYCAHPATRFDLGGVIKEYAVDRAVALAEAAGAQAGIVNFGGDLRVFGQPPDTDCFKIGVENPRQPDQVLFGLTLYQQALASSGHHARRTWRNGQWHSHIQPGLSEPAASWLQASVIAPDALSAGIYATALLLRPDLALPPGYSAVLVDAELKLHPRSA